MINGRNFLDQLVKIEMRIYDNITKFTSDQGDYYTTGFCLDYSYFQENYKLIEIDLSKQQTPNDDTKVIQQINSTGILERAGNTTIFFITEKVKLNVLDFSQGTVKL